MITIALHAHLGFRPWVARVTGRDPKYGLAQSFVRANESSSSRSGRTGNKTWHIDEPGLYRIGGTKRDDTCLLVWLKNGDLTRTDIDMVRAKVMAKLMDEGADFEAARQATKPQPKQSVEPTAVQQ